MTDRNTKSGTTTTGRDLRFAGTVAAGLCAGVLGVGAIAVPLVGWNDWPQALTSSNGDPIRLTTVTGGGATGSAGAKTRYTPRTTISGPTGAIALLTASGAPSSPGTAVSGGTGSSGASGGSAAGGTRTVKRSRTDLTGAGGGSTSSGKFRANGFADAPADSDGDGIADDYERAQGLTVGVDDAQSDSDGDGLTNVMEFRLRSSANAKDSNNDGVDDGADDADLDGVPNAVEIALGTNPYAADSDNDGTRDGDIDTDGDGITNAVEIATGTDPGVSDTPVAPETPAEPEAPADPALSLIHI